MAENEEHSSKKDFIKRRRVPRRDFKKKIGLLIRGDYHVNICTQVGEGGMMLHSHIRMKEGQLLVIIFKLPNCQETVVRAVVRYIVEKKMSPFGNAYGVEFENLEFKVRREIRNYVASKSEAEYEHVA